MTSDDPPPADSPDESRGPAESTAPPAGADPAAAGEPAIHRRGRLLALAGWAALGVVVLGVTWVVITGLVARSKLDDARSRITELRAAVLASDTARADRLVTAIAEDTASAHELTSGPAWWVSANVPVLGSPLRTARVLAVQADHVGSEVLPGLLRLATTVPDTARDSSSAIDLDAVADAAVPLGRASRSADTALQAVDAVEGSWLPPVSDARDSFARQLRRLQGELTGADRAVRIALPMLGRDGPQRYFVGFLNEAESRGGGGIPGAFAIVTAEDGRIRFERFGTDSDLTGVRAAVDLGPEFDSRYGNNDPTSVLPNSNLSPDFSYAARIWAGMWQKKTGERIDGALALDPTALGYLLSVTGPARLPDGQRITGGDAVAITQKRQYELFPGTSVRENTERKAYLVSIARAVSERLTSGNGSPTGLVRAISRAAGERRFTVWSARPDIEGRLRAARWAGALGNDTGSPYSGFVVNNAGGNKLDYYLRRAMTYRRSACGPGAPATATIALTNTAPRSGLPPYVTIRMDDAATRARPGDNRLLLTYYADRRAKITTLTVDGKPVPLLVLPEGNTVAATTTIELPAGATVTATVTISEPRADGPVTVLRQPGVSPLQVDLSRDTCR